MRSSSKRESIPIDLYGGYGKYIEDQEENRFIVHSLSSKSCLDYDGKENQNNNDTIENRNQNKIK